MGRRTLTASEITFHEKYVRKPRTFAPADLEGEHLADVFEKFAKSLTTADTADPKRQSWTQISTVQRYTPAVVVVTLGTGSYGEPGPIIDSVTGDAVGELTDIQAPTGENRAILMVPPVGESAYFLAEQSARGAAGSHLLRLFRRHFSKTITSITMAVATVTESEAWSAQADLREIEVRIEGKPTDLADGRKVQVGKLSHIARPPRRTIFPRNLLQILGDRSEAGRLVGIVDPPDDAEVLVTMERDGRTKTFHVESDGAPAIREVLNDGTEPALSIMDLVDVCASKVSDLAARTGGSWDQKWSTP